MSAGIGIWACRGVFADDAFYLWTLTTTGEPFTYPSRAFGQLVMQAPVTLGMHLGVDDAPTLLRLQSLGAIGIPAAMWAAALVVLRRDRAFWPLAVVAALVVGTSGFMSIGEYNLAYAAVGVSAAFLLREGPLTRAALVALPVLAALMLFSYEGLIVLLPFLAVLLVLRVRTLRRSGHRWRGLWPLGATLVLYATAAGICAWYIRFPRDPRNLGTAADILLPLQRSEQLRLALAAVVLLVAAWLIPVFWMRVIAGALATTAAVVVLIRPDGWSTPGTHYDARALVALAMLVLLTLIALGTARRSRRPDEPAESTVAGAATAIGVGALLVALTLPLTLQTVEFAGWLAAVDRTVSEPGAPLPVDEAGLPAAGTALFAWGWTSPYLSRLLGEPDGIVLLAPGTTPETAPVPAPLPARFDTLPPVFPSR